METNNITDTIVNSLNTIFKNLQDSLDGNVFKILDEITFINTDILDNSYFSNLLSDKANGIILIANALLFAVLIYYAISHLFSHFSMSNSSQSPLQFISKFVFCALLINFSEFICEQIIYIFSLVTDCVRNIGLSFFSINVSFSLWSEQVNDVFLSETFPSIDIFTFAGILKSFLCFGSINLLFTYSLRYIFIKILILFFPFAILSICLDSTKWIFKMWLKNFASLLFVQIIVSVILLITISLKYTFSDTTIKVLYIGTLFALMKANSFIREFFSGFATDVTNGFNSMRNLLG